MLSPLSTPDLAIVPSLERLQEYDAIRLFLERAQSARASFALTRESALWVVQICRRLDGLPLAIELAAARAGTMPLAEIAARLDARLGVSKKADSAAAARHRTLWAAVDWSYDLLSEPERALFQRLAVFTGGFSLAAAEAVCAGDGIDPEDVLDLLARLVEKSLVVLEEGDATGRYRLLETLRQYAFGKLTETGEAGRLRARHRNHFLESAEASEPLLRGPEQGAALRRLEAEHENLRAALHWSRQEPDGAVCGLRLIGALGWFWFMRGYLTEGRQHVQAFYADADVPPGVRASALAVGGLLAWRQGDYDLASTWCEESYALFERIDDTHGCASVLYVLGNIAQYRGDYPKAVRLYDESMARFEQARDDWGVGLVLRLLGQVALLQGDSGGAARRFEESLFLVRRVGDLWALARLLRWVAVVRLQDRRLDDAMAAADESLTLYQKVGDKFGLAMAQVTLGQTEYHRGRFDRANALFRDSLTLLRELGSKDGISEVLEGLAIVAVSRDQPGVAATLLGTADGLRAAIGTPLSPTSRPTHEGIVADVRGSLGEDRFDAAWRTGRSMLLDQAVAYALQETERVGEMEKG